MHNNVVNKFLSLCQESVAVVTCVAFVVTSFTSTGCSTIFGSGETSAAQTDGSGAMTLDLAATSLRDFPMTLALDSLRAGYPMEVLGEVSFVLPVSGSTTQSDCILGQKVVSSFQRTDTDLRRFQNLSDLNSHLQVVDCEPQAAEQTPSVTWRSAQAKAAMAGYVTDYIAHSNSQDKCSLTSADTFSTSEFGNWWSRTAPSYASQAGTFSLSAVYGSEFVLERTRYLTSKETGLYVRLLGANEDLSAITADSGLLVNEFRYARGMTPEQIVAALKQALGAPSTSASTAFPSCRSTAAGGNMVVAKMAGRLSPADRQPLGFAALANDSDGDGIPNDTDTDDDDANCAPGAKKKSTRLTDAEQQLEEMRRLMAEMRQGNHRTVLLSLAISGGLAVLGIIGGFVGPIIYQKLTGVTDSLSNADPNAERIRTCNVMLATAAEKEGDLRVDRATVRLLRVQAYAMCPELAPPEATSEATNDPESTPGPTTTPSPVLPSPTPTAGTPGSWTP